ncbi:hypothetical protein B0H17DRAFT_1143311 [Mycena rosella]|uniref:Uncharacterized protein n=1 Tax=Mycena rosella TaxID=1033263 RepID=A0AAD7CVB9_MYCRO|nr:hypothetical protein B0H17DRAFT_1143311 [Mycena rosella]
MPLSARQPVSCSALLLHELLVFNSSVRSLTHKLRTLLETEAMALEISEEMFPGVKYLKLEVECGFRFWDTGMDGGQTVREEGRARVSGHTVTGSRTAGASARYFVLFGFALGLAWAWVGHERCVGAPYSLWCFFGGVGRVWAHITHYFCTGFSFPNLTAAAFKSAVAAFALPRGPQRLLASRFLPLIPPATQEPGPSLACNVGILVPDCHHSRSCGCSVNSSCRSGRVQFGHEELSPSFKLAHGGSTPAWGAAGGGYGEPQDQESSAQAGTCTGAQIWSVQFVRGAGAPHSRIALGACRARGARI